LIAPLSASGGRLVAVLPASARGKDILPGINATWSREYKNEFSGTSIAELRGRPLADGPA
jgi:hypothetical protein